MRFLFILCEVLGALLLVGCGPLEAPSELSIKGGVPTTNHPEGALVWMTEKFTAEAKSFRCSGSLIAPRVVLTAAHCVGGFHLHEVVIPSVSSEKISVENSVMFDWPDRVSPEVVWASHDVAVLILEQPIALKSYPRLASKKVADGTKAYSIGRVQDNAVSNEQLFQGPAYPVYDGKSKGVGNYYLSQEVFEGGDSGGAVFSRDRSGDLLIGVNSGAVNGTEVIGRVDQVYAWIQSQILAHP